MLYIKPDFVLKIVMDQLVLGREIREYAEGFCDFSGMTNTLFCFVSRLTSS